MPGYDKATTSVSVPDHVMHREVLDEAVMLNLETERYTGLDKVGVDMLEALTAAPSLDAAIDRLVREYDADRDVIAADVERFVDDLVGRGLIVVDDIAA